MSDRDTAMDPTLKFLLVALVGVAAGLWVCLAFQPKQPTPQNEDKKSDKNPQPPEVMKIYEILSAKLNQEGDGIWSRFNILVGINLALFAGFAFVYSRKHSAVLWWWFALGICLAGVLASIWSLYVLKKLWKWHKYWKDELVAIEEKFPSDWPRPQTKPQTCRQRRPTERERPGGVTCP